MRTWTILVSIAGLALSVGSGVTASETDPFEIERTAIAEGVWEWSDADGVRHLCASGRPGLEWNIERYQGHLASLVTEDGYIDWENREMARFLVQRLAKLRGIPVFHMSMLKRDSMTCGSGSETCDSPNEFDWKTDVDLSVVWGGVGRCAQAWVDSDLTDCANEPEEAWMSDGEAFVYVKQTQQSEPVTDSDTGTGRFLDLDADVCWYWTTPYCRYAFAELSVYDNAMDDEYYYYCEREDPGDCSPY